MLKLAVDIRMIGSGGIGSYISEIVPHLLKKADCLLIGTHEQAMPFVRMENVEFCFCDVKPFALKELTSFPREVLSKINAYDAYYTPYCNIPNGITVPVFSTIHDVVFLDVLGLTGTIGRMARKAFYKRAVNLSKAIFTVSNFSRERITHHLLRSAHKKPLVLTYNGISHYLTEPFEEEKPKKQDEILFVGNIKKHKGLSILLEAFESAREKGLSSKLVIVGNADNFRTGDEETAARLKALQQKDESAVNFTGRISNEELKNYYARVKLLVQPSLYEGFGIPPLEAMTLGTPAIISDIPVFKEIYGSYPVTFFKAGDAGDLAEKLLTAKTDAVDIKDAKPAYSYKEAAEIILKTITATP